MSPDFKNTNVRNIPEHVSLYPKEAGEDTNVTAWEGL